MSRSSRSVAILLNERESPKSIAATELQNLLLSQGIPATRFQVTPEPSSLLAAARPAAIVLDYLLGDYTTGLDVLEQLNQFLPLEERPPVYFLTDEPSVQVAVSAMRMGARNYVLLQGRESIKEMAQEIIANLPALSTSMATREMRLSLDDLRPISEAGLSMINNTRAAQVKGSLITVFFGPVGSGRSFLARALHFARSNVGVLKEISPSCSTEKYEPLLGLSWSTSRSLRLGLGLSLLVKNIEDDAGELFYLCNKHRERIWLEKEHYSATSFLYLTTACKTTALAWARQLNAQVVTVPSISERLEDLPTIVDQILKRAALLSSRPIARLSNDLLGQLASWCWPGEILELSTVITEAVLLEPEKASSPQIIPIITACKIHWEEWFIRQTPLSDEIRSDIAQEVVEPLLVLQLLNSYQWNLRRVAAHLGITNQELRSILEGSAKKVGLSQSDQPIHHHAELVTANRKKVPEPTTHNSAQSTAAKKGAPLYE